MRMTLTITALSLACCTASAALAQARSCEDLWWRRNYEYKSAGYCFRTQRAISVFGNAGCQYDDMASVPLSPVQRRLVADIVGQERAMGCQ